MGVVSDITAGLIVCLLSILYMCKPSCRPMFEPPSLGPPLVALQSRAASERFERLRGFVECLRRDSGAGLPEGCEGRKLRDKGVITINYCYYYYHCY